MKRDKEPSRLTDMVFTLMAVTLAMLVVLAGAGALTALRAPLEVHKGTRSVVFP